jgi:hypothetical protein
VTRTQGLGWSCATTPDMAGGGRGCNGKRQAAANVALAAAVAGGGAATRVAAVADISGALSLLLLPPPPPVQPTPLTAGGVVPCCHPVRMRWAAYSSSSTAST